jgi:hypothetical protein
MNVLNANSASYFIINKHFENGLDVFSLRHSLVYNFRNYLFVTNISHGCFCLFIF